MSVFLVSVACCQVGSLRRADHSSREGVQSVACLTMIVNRRHEEAH